MARSILIPAGLMLFSASPALAQGPVTVGDPSNPAGVPSAPTLDAASQPAQPTVPQTTLPPSAREGLDTTPSTAPPTATMQQILPLGIGAEPPGEATVPGGTPMTPRIDFSAADRNQDGRLDRGEFARAYRAPGASPTARLNASAAVFDRADADNDGHLSRAELIAFRW